MSVPSGEKEHRKEAVLCSVSQSCLTLQLHGLAALKAPLSMGILQARILQWVAMPSSRGSSQPRDQTRVSCIFSVSGTFFTTEPPEKPPDLVSSGANVSRVDVSFSPCYQTYLPED